MQAKNVCHDNFMFQNEDTSSIENNSPPTGAPKAEATPAAAPAEMKLRLLKTNNTCSKNTLTYNYVDFFYQKYFLDNTIYLPTLMLSD